MGSKREEERNEKIIRGLMKLPPNRRCINCNSLGPQYVCTDFWTFICMTCSGIHREFTHRVKSVSMAKFSSQEVEAIQNGGNQRARDIYLKDWDLQRQRLPDNSNVEKSPRIHEDGTRRASSYHSYSQSPPYDYQYEDRRYGKQAGALTRKPGSDRGLYAGKMSSFVYSPGRLSDKMYEDRFANEGSVSRVSDYSVSSAGDPFRSSAESPNFDKDCGFSSPPFPQAPLVLEQESSAASSVDLFSKPVASSAPSLDLFHPSIVSSASSGNVYQPPQTFPSSSLDFFTEISQQQSVATLDKETPQLCVPTNDGWATFDTPKPAASEPAAGNLAPGKLPSRDVDSLEKFDFISSLNTNMQWPPFQSESVCGLASTKSNQWPDDLHNVQASNMAPSTLEWSAFEGSIGNLSFEGNKQGSEIPLETHNLSSTFDQYLQDSTKEGIQRTTSHGVSLGPSVPSHVVMGPLYTPVLPLMGETQSHPMECKSTNPFDLPFDSDLEQKNMFLDIGSLQAALPDAQLPSTFHSGVSQPWFPQNAVSPYIPAAGQGGLTYMSAQAPNSQIG
ncbi:putative ADP-ribosylation factor GTPase-activating protein AGD14 [Morella rubra]|uniref:Putative ADP-ribosylation factor GTPase-activating protein AGD14 n=1 Tax=Morella rubra TaxID=262757 RepID=A0A6A1WPL0_9ROSI|nr:putative ADP-ribosylation factor GTPase-activating protein AGD14 [Morella rubra]